ncbi:MAG TPA: histidinol-phosphate transaminase [Alphaproteobacteria bacterium]|nr:histidinol-phosphate transaminase [Alphaproteobacteria bacterium]HNS44584.1 histidinol-phosphate transaminase [Alphaproteobacteria bacterium]
MSVKNLARAAILAMPPYKSARSLYQGSEDTVYLDANECAYEPYIGSMGNNRYPAKQPKGAVEALCRLYDVSSRNLILTRGADEAIDLLVRAFCDARKDQVIICPPTFPMYAQAATIQGAGMINVPLVADFALDVDGIKTSATPTTKIIFICSPNNPTGNVIPVEVIVELCEFFKGKSLVVVDETYIEYAKTKTCIGIISKYPNLVVLRTISKAYAAAGVRAGGAIADAEIIELLIKIQAPYPIPQPVAREIETILEPKNRKKLEEKLGSTINRRDLCLPRLEKLADVEKVFLTTTNYVLVKVKNAAEFVEKCREAGVIIRDQSYQIGLENCVRISIGSDEDMERLFAAVEGREILPIKDDRTSCTVRKTKETAIEVKINLDKQNPVLVATGIGFYDHMLEQIARHGGFSLQLSCEGDLEIDPHHTVEDCAIALGTALKQALGDKRGIGRYGFVVPMDESLCEVAIDLSGRYYLSFEADFSDQAVGELPVDMVEHIFRSLAENLGMNCHIKVKGENTHHMVEACFKAFGRALGMAIRKDGDNLPSTKGAL